MVIFIKDKQKIKWSMDMEYINGKMEIIIKVNGFLMPKMDREK